MLKIRIQFQTRAKEETLFEDDVTNRINPSISNPASSISNPALPIQTTVGIRIFHHIP